MPTVSIEEAHTRLPELIDRLASGEELVITRNGLPVARLIGEKPEPRRPQEPGSAVGKLLIGSEDDDHLEDFKDYMP
jgi:prevent-host-death family protein